MGISSNRLSCAVMDTAQAPERPCWSVSVLCQPGGLNSNPADGTQVPEQITRRGRKRGKLQTLAEINGSFTISMRMRFLAVIVSAPWAVVISIRRCCNGIHDKAWTRCHPEGKRVSHPVMPSQFFIIWLNILGSFPDIKHTSSQLYVSPPSSLLLPHR